MGGHPRAHPRCRGARGRRDRVPPAIFFGDSWAYLDLAYNGTPVGLAPDRPSGYPLLIDLLSVVGRSLAITTAQHLAGLAVGVLVYTLLIKLGLPRLLATAGTALVLLDGYAIALEQQIMAESFFALASWRACIWRESHAGRHAGREWAAAGRGRDDANSCAVRCRSGSPVLWTHGRSRAVAAGMAVLLVPVLAHSAIYAVNTGHFGLGQADGWFLYGRVGQFADCGNARILAERGRFASAPSATATRSCVHVWNADGPARRVRGG